MHNSTVLLNGEKLIHSLYANAVIGFWCPIYSNSISFDSRCQRRAFISDEAAMKSQFMSTLLYLHEIQRHQKLPVNNLLESALKAASQTYIMIRILNDVHLNQRHFQFIQNRLMFIVLLSCSLVDEQTTTDCTKRNSFNH